MQVQNLDREPISKGLIIVPAYNESESVRQLLVDLQEQHPALDVLLIDDGSTDGTSDHAPGGSTVLRLPFNMGIGVAMQTGYKYAQLHGYSMAIQVDGDGQHPPSEVARLINHLSENQTDMVIGSRFKGRPTYVQTFSRRFGAQILRALIRTLVGLDITDCTSGFRVVNRKVIELFAQWYPEDYPEPEVVVLLHRAGLKIDEIPVQMAQRKTGQTSIPWVKGFFYMIKVSTCLVLDMARNPWPDEKAVTS